MMKPAAASLLVSNHVVLHLTRFISSVSDSQEIQLPFIFDSYFIGVHLRELLKDIRDELWRTIGKVSAC